MHQVSWGGLEVPAPADMELNGGRKTRQDFTQDCAGR